MYEIVRSFGAEKPKHFCPSDRTRVLSIFLETPKRPDLANFDVTEKEQRGGKKKKNPQLTHQTDTVEKKKP